MHYDKDQAIKILKDEINWRDYGGKHNESIITKFYQNYILPKKFKIDKRRAHLSSLICSKQISRKYALELLKQPLYTEEELKKDKNYFLKKLELNESDFEMFMTAEPKSHYDYPNYKNLFNNPKKLLVK